MVYVAVDPPKTLDEGLLRKAAALIGKDISDTRLLLSGEIPRIVAPCPGADTAESMAQGLREAGLGAFVCGDSELRKNPAGFIAHTAKCGVNEVIFGDRGGGEIRVQTGDAFLIIRGRRQIMKKEEITVTKRKLNLPATVLTGGVPIMRRVTKTTTKESFQVEDFAGVFDRKSSDPLVEMFENHVDYAFLGSERAPSAPANFKILVAKLREWFPRAIFDERLIRHYKRDESAGGPGDTLHLNGKLIYLSHRAIDRRR